jgi:hypothetical protein
MRSPVWGSADIFASSMSSGERGRPVERQQLAWIDRAVQPRLARRRLVTHGHHVSVSRWPTSIRRSRPRSPRPTRLTMTTTTVTASTSSPTPSSSPRTKLRAGSARGPATPNSTVPSTASSGRTAAAATPRSGWCAAAGPLSSSRSCSSAPKVSCWQVQTVPSVGARSSPSGASRPDPCAARRLTRYVRSVRRRSASPEIGRPRFPPVST